MEGVAAPPGWKGDLVAPYNLGPNLKNNMTVKMQVNTSNRNVTTYNTIAILRGEVEPGTNIIGLNIHLEKC